jgi:hypothetical protein
MRPGSFLKTGFWKSLRGKKNDVDMVEKLEPLDVLLVESHDAFQPNVTQVGNNRLSILMEVQHDEYRKASAEDRESIVQDMVQTVISHWGGRFLSVAPFTTSGNDTYQKLTERQAPLAVQALFENSFTGGATTAAMVALGRPSSEAGSVSTTSSAKRPATVKKEAVHGLHHLQPPITESSSGAAEEAEHMRSAALKSLQKRKQRQGLATKIRSLTTTALTRGVSEPTKQNKPQTEQRRNSSMDGSYLNSNDTTPLPIHDRTARLSNLSEGVLGDLLDNLDVSGDLGMSEEFEYDNGSLQDF